jgi:hypothetical protein
LLISLIEFKGDAERQQLRPTVWFSGGENFRERARDVHAAKGSDTLVGERRAGIRSENWLGHGTIEMDDKHPADETQHKPIHVLLNVFCGHCSKKVHAWGEGRSRVSTGLQV